MLVVVAPDPRKETLISLVQGLLWEPEPEEHKHYNLNGGGK